MKSGITVTKLEPFMLDGELFQFRVVAVSDGALPKNIGYVGTADGDYFAPLCHFPMEHAASVQEQIQKLKAGMSSESTREIAGETSTDQIGDNRRRSI